MLNYKTVTEKAEEWNVSPRHLQYLCKNGKIEGAIKKAGVWLIPEGAPIPIQYSRPIAGRFVYVGTKKKIFDCAIDLFKRKGFEAVGMKDIADAVGITQSSMYNHFKSKQDILDTIYDFYCYYFHKDLPTIEKIRSVLENGSLVDIFRSTTFLYDESYAKQMAGIAAIIFYRCAIDDRAKELMQSYLVDSGVRVAKAVFDMAVDIGRIAPTDTHSIAVFINSLKLYSLHIWIVDNSVETSVKMRKDEIELYKHAANLLTDLKPPKAD